MKNSTINIFKIIAFSLIFMLSACDANKEGSSAITGGSASGLDSKDASGRIDGEDASDSTGGSVASGSTDEVSLDNSIREEGDGEIDKVESDPDFIKKATAVSFSQVKLYEGHHKIGEECREMACNLVELDPSNLNSGDLITVDVELEVTGLENYTISIHLVPIDIFSKLGSGDTLGAVSNYSISEEESDRIIDLGGAYFDWVQPVQMYGEVQAKLPVLEEDTTYKLVVIPSLEFLSSGKEINITDADSVPLFVDPRDLVIHKLEKIEAKIINLPDLTVDNEFTQLDKSARFGRLKEYTDDPLFQTSVEVDISSFNESENIVLSLSWISDRGAVYPLGLLTTNADNNPVITEEANFLIQQVGATTVTVPVAAYASRSAHSALLREATFIKDIATETVETGSFSLKVSYVEGGSIVDAGTPYELKIPLVSQDTSAQVLASDDLVSFAVLRAGFTDSACITFPRDFGIDRPYLAASRGVITASRGVITPDNTIISLPCPADGVDIEAAYPDWLWRYDSATKQFVSKATDDGKNYCLTAVGVGELDDLGLRECEFLEGTAAPQQRFEFEGDKIKLLVNSKYLTVDPIGGSVLNDVKLIDSSDRAPDFFRNTDGIEVDSSGRLFYLGGSKTMNLGNADKAQISLNFSGESYLDYLPILGVTTEGKASLGASIFGARAKLIDSSFTQKRYLNRKTSINFGDVTPIVIGNGAELKLDVLGARVVSEGSIKTETVTENFNPHSVLADLEGAVPTLVPVENSILGYSESFGVDAAVLKLRMVIVVVPVTIEGGFSGTVGFVGGLDSVGLGLKANLTERIDVSGYLNAKVDLFVASAGLEGRIEFINQVISFAANAGLDFVTPPGKVLPEIAFNIGSNLHTSLKLIKGKVLVFAEYRKVCFCWSVGKKIKKEFTLYDSPYLFNASFDTYETDGEIEILNIGY